VFEFIVNVFIFVTSAKKMYEAWMRIARAPGVH